MTEANSAPWVRLIGSYWPLYGLLFLIGTENFIVSPLLPSMASDTGIAVTGLAGMVTSYAIAYAVLAPVLGQISDKVGRGLLILVGGLLFVGGNLSVATASSLPMLLASRAVMGMGAAMAGPAMWAHIADTTSTDLRGQAMGLGMGAFSLGQTVGIPVGGAVAAFMSWRWALGGIGTLMLPLLLVMAMTVRGRRVPPVKPLGRAGGLPVFSIWSNSAVRYLLAITFLFQAGNLATYTYLGDLLSRIHQLSTGQIGLIGIVVGIGSLVGALAGGKLSDAWHARGRRREELVVIWSLLLALAILAATGSVPTGVALLGIAFWFLASGAFVTTQQTLVTLAAPEARATAVSWNNSIMYLGAGLGVWAMGIGAHHQVNIGMAGSVIAMCAAGVAVLLNTMNPMESEEAV